MTPTVPKTSLEPHIEFLRSRANALRAKYPKGAYVSADESFDEYQDQIICLTIVEQYRLTALAEEKAEKRRAKAS